MIFGINTTSDISELLFYIISRAARRVKFGAILKYHKWYLCQISRTIQAITCLYYNLRNSVIEPYVFIFVELFCVGEKIGFEVLDFGPAGPGQRTFSVFWFSEFSFKFLNLLILKSRLNLNSCDEIIW